MITRINDFQGTIAAAVEQQSATTGSMAGDLNRAAGGATDIKSSTAEVVAAANQTQLAAQATETAATDLAAMSQSMQAAVARFQY